MKVINLEKSIFTNSTMREELNKYTTQVQINDLTSEEPKSKREAAKGLIGKVSDNALNEELRIVAEIAKREDLLNRVAKEKKKIDGMTKEGAKKYEKEVAGYTKATEKATEEIIELAGRRTMSDDELKKRLKRALA